MFNAYMSRDICRMIALDYSLLVSQFFEYMDGWYMHVFFTYKNSYMAVNFLRHACWDRSFFIFFFINEH